MTRELDNLAMLKGGRGVAKNVWVVLTRELTVLSILKGGAAKGGWDKTFLPRLERVCGRKQIWTRNFPHDKTGGGGGKCSLTPAQKWEGGGGEQFFPFYNPPPLVMTVP